MVMGIVPSKDWRPPDWWSAKGTKMRVEAFAPAQNYLRVCNRAAKIEVSYELNGNTVELQRFWQVGWSIQHAASFVSGRLYFENEHLAAAFGLNDNCTTEERAYVEEYQATCGAAGLFLRKDQFLVLPVPSYGFDRHPSVSVELDNEMKSAVQKLLRL